jgi:uncharacterized circularly permuted ATP-grasp superfamily protein/uncharacterized alpha-E superfamily protein
MTTNVSNNPVARPRGFAAGYVARQSGRDEMIEPDGALHPHWRMLVSQLDEIGPQGMISRWEQARQLIRENGITHNVYGDPNGVDRPWNLDFVPLLIPVAEWRQVSDGLNQRARLLDALLADLYGPRRCLSEGWLPPELVFANPGFLRACHGVTLPQGRWLHLYAADLIRLADGQFTVLCDRTQSPSGQGYSLENRIVLTSVLPGVFRQCNVHRLAPFFIALRQTLRSLAPPQRENPRIVLLTPGPYNETYFEHSYLARYLGYTLVEGNDLTVRDGFVYLKTLSGLQRIDVILRRVDDNYCDPLELLQSSYLGVPGLVEAMRQGNVAVANALGSGVAQAPAFLTYLPGLCRNLLGEELKLPSVRTWWCGDADSRRYVLENIARLVIKPAFATTGSDPEFGEGLSGTQLDQLKAQIIARPNDFIAQEHVASRTAPVLLDNQIEARRFVVRAYAVADRGNYTVMTGGLTRVTGSRDSLVVSMQRGGGSKDTWILASGPVNEATLLSTTTLPLVLSRGGGELSSRLADDLFWLGRYVQRAECQVRLARGMFTRLMGQGRSDVLGTVHILTRALFGHTRFRLDESGLSALVCETFSPGGAGSMRPAIGHVRNLIRGLRDRLSADAWRILQWIDDEVANFKLDIGEDEVSKVVEMLNKLTAAFLAFGGVVAESMTRGQAWRFLDMGNRVERAAAVARLVRGTLVDVAADESSILDAVLDVGDCSLTYRRRYFTQLEVPAVVDLLVADESNPRSAAFQVALLEEHLAMLPREASHPRKQTDQQAALRLRTNLRLADFHNACKPNSRGTRPVLDTLMVDIIDGVATISEIVSQTYFSHAALARSLHRQGEEKRR